MLRLSLCCFLLAASVTTTAAEPATQKSSGAPEAAVAGASKTRTTPGGDVVMAGLSIVGNEETPKELVIVPWKSSQLADAPGISRLLDDGTQPVDKDVFMRELAYYGLRTAAPDGN